MKHAPSRQLRRIAGLMQWFCLGAMAVTALASALTGIQMLADPAQIGGHFPDAPLYADRITRTHIVLALAVNLVTVLLICRALYALWGMFCAFRLGEIISLHTASLMRIAGGTFLGAAIWTTVANTLTILILTASNPPGQRQLDIGIGSEQLFPILLAGVLFAIGHVMTAATEIEAENRAFV